MKTRPASALILFLSLLLFVSTSALAANPDCLLQTCDNCEKFLFTTNFSYNPDIDLTNVFNPTYADIEKIKPFSDIRMDSVTYVGKTRHGMMFVTGANIINNNFDDKTGADSTGFVRKPWWVINTGRGHNTTFDPYVTQGPTSGENGATNADMVAAYANRNLTSINYNRERGSVDIPAVFEISFPYATDTFFFWERGTDSHIHAEFLDENGIPVANSDICWQELQPAGYSIYTDTGFNWPIGANPQKCGSIGVKLDGVSVKTLRILIYHPEDFGADLKIMAAPKGSTSAAVLLKEASELISALEEGCFRNPNLRTPLMEKLAAASHAIANGGYNGAAQKLRNDLLPKIGACDEPSKKDWITCCPSAMNKNYIPTIKNLITEAIDLLE